MGKIVLVTGGARSGKSTFAEAEVRKLNKETAYIATGIAFDEAMKSRIDKHVAQRPSSWTTYEKPTQVHEIIEEVSKDHQVVLLDCITVLLTNTLFQDQIDFDGIDEKTVDLTEERIQHDIKMMIDKFKETNMTVYLVTNEVGSGIVPENRLARIFRDFAGRTNQYIASVSDEVYCVISGIPMKLKG